ncbi:MAG: cyclic nucleotide-binding domain-containing protein [Desulfobacterales bacterium]|nr:cyclic nucleotide-binding domain-containing protein [Deltaproteobacteria bacterium]NNL42514.1 cyclic nucleotide-binding domain-containing protein [Desulfobacterales bacterium]
MFKPIGRWLNIYEDEIQLFLWIVALLFFVRSSGILLNNYAETAFLKRYGVEYMPVVNMLNAVATFVIMGFMAVIMGKIPGSRLLFYLFLFCGGSVAGLRALIPFGIDLIYPVLFMLKSQYEVLLALVFWNLANDLFNTRQSKRLFPLVTAGGVVGQIIGSFGTPFLARAITFDNLLLAYLGVTLLGAVVVKRMSLSFPALLISDKKSKKTKSRTPMLEEIKKVIPLVKESVLVKILIVLTLMPNVVIPIMNYQFNYAVNEQFATEATMIQFFSYFRGVLNIISLIILLFVGRIYGRWGLPIALMFHPFNYMLAFFAFLFRFDVFSAIYARMSTNILRVTINIPANAVMMGLFPDSYRSMIRPFLRGTVVRIGLFLGSGFILISTTLFHPRYLSLVAIPFVAAWIAAPFILKRRYSKILLELISKNLLDLKSMEKEDMGQLFNDKKIQGQLVQSFLSAKGDDCLWYARLLESLSVKDLDTHILTCLASQDDKTKIGLLELISPQAGKETIETLKKMADPEKPDLMVAIIKVINRLSLAVTTTFKTKAYLTSSHPEIKAYAVVALFNSEPAKYEKMIHSWLDSADELERKAGLIAAGEARNISYTSKLKQMLDNKENTALFPFILRSLNNLKVEEPNLLFSPYLSHEVESVRLAAVEVFAIDHEDSLRKIIPLMDDSSEQVRKLAKKRINNSSYQNPSILIESLSIPRHSLREGIYELLSSQNIKDIDIYHYARSQVKKAYICLAQGEALGLMPKGSKHDLLTEHLKQKRMQLLENTLRVLATQELLGSGQMRIIWRGITSADSRQRSNSIEILDDVMDHSLSKILIPLLEDLSPAECLRTGGKYFQLPVFKNNLNLLYSQLLTEEDWVTVMLALHLLDVKDCERLDQKIVNQLKQSNNDYVKSTFKCMVGDQPSTVSERKNKMETEISIPDKILYLRKISILQGLSVSELAAVASVTEMVAYPIGETVIKEGDSGDTMYLIIKGEVAVIQTQGVSSEIEVDQIGEGDYFGEMALLDDIARSATIRTKQESHLLVLHKLEFTEIVREYPQIALQISKELSRRLRKQKEKMKHFDNCSLEQ